jgi:hypothetical protein
MSGIEHIMYRHAANSGFVGVSRYAAGASARSVVGLVDRGLRYGTVTQTAPTAFTIDYNVGTAIGTDTLGQAATSLRIFVRNGVIQTAFPF